MQALFWLSLSYFLHFPPSLFLLIFGVSSYFSPYLTPTTQPNDNRTILISRAPSPWILYLFLPCLTFSHPLCLLSSTVLEHSLLLPGITTWPLSLPLTHYPPSYLSFCTNPTLFSLLFSFVKDTQPAAQPYYLLLLFVILSLSILLSLSLFPSYHSILHHGIMH